jgi:hypothetical protein
LNDPSPKADRSAKLGIGTQILLGMVAGAVLGAFFGEGIVWVEPVGDLFIRLLMLAAIPLVFFNLLAGLTSLTDLRTFGRLAGKIVTFFLATTAVAVVLGMMAIGMLRPGVGMTLTEAVERDVASVPSVAEILLGLVPDSAAPTRTWPSCSGNWWTSSCSWRPTASARSWRSPWAGTGRSYSGPWPALSVGSGRHTWSWCSVTCFS